VDGIGKTICGHSPSLPPPPIQDRELQTLTDNYAMGDLIATQNGNVITISNTHGPGDGTSFGEWRFYYKQSVTAAILAGDAPLSDSCVTGTAIREGVDNTGIGFSGTSVPFSGNSRFGFTFTGQVNTVGAGTSSMSFYLDSSIRNNAGAYAYDPDTGTGKAVFCVFFGRRANNIYNINYKEMALEVELSVDGTFTMTGLNSLQVSPNDIQENVDNDIAYSVYGEACEGVPGPVNGIITQSTAIPL
jgi:hypothetical protein